MLRQLAALFRRPRVGWPVGIEQGGVARSGSGPGCGSRAGRRARWHCSGRRSPAVRGAALQWRRRYAPTEVLLEGADEAFRDAVAFRLADEGRRALDAEEGDLVLEVTGHVVGAVVVAKREALGDVPLNGAEVAQDALTHRLERLEAAAGAGGMAADALAGAVVGGDEDPGPPLVQGDGLGHIGPPHRIHRSGGDGAIVRSPCRTADPVRREQTVPAHQAPDPPGRGADPGMAQAGPDLAVGLPLQARAEDPRPDVLQ